MLCPAPVLFNKEVVAHASFLHLLWVMTLNNLHLCPSPEECPWVTGAALFRGTWEVTQTSLSPRGGPEPVTDECKHWRAPPAPSGCDNLHGVIYALEFPWNQAEARLLRKLHLCLVPSLKPRHSSQSPYASPENVTSIHHINKNHYIGSASNQTPPKTRIQLEQFLLTQKVNLRQNPEILSIWINLYIKENKNSLFSKDPETHRCLTISELARASMVINTNSFSEWMKCRSI